MEMPEDNRSLLMHLYTIYDRVAERAGPVFVQVNDATASREFRLSLQSSSVADAEDYQLMRLGTWDPKKCWITVEDVPLVVHVSMPKQGMLPGVELYKEGK